jgi:hypothetical protein
MSGKRNKRLRKALGYNRADGLKGMPERQYFLLTEKIPEVKEGEEEIEKKVFEGKSFGIVTDKNRRAYQLAKKFIKENSSRVKFESVEEEVSKRE